MVDIDDNDDLVLVFHSKKRKKISRYLNGSFQMRKPYNKTKPVHYQMQTSITHTPNIFGISILSHDFFLWKITFEKRVRIWKQRKKICRYNRFLFLFFFEWKFLDFLLAERGQQQQQQQKWKGRKGIWRQIMFCFFVVWHLNTKIFEFQG